MKQKQFSIEIAAPSWKVWGVLWQDETFREWASVIDPGTYMVGELKEGNEVQFISSENGYGVTSLVEKLEVGKSLVLRHRADTKESGKQARKDEWSGGEEGYLLVENEGKTTLTAWFDVPLQMEAYFDINYPKALGVVKTLAE